MTIYYYRADSDDGRTLLHEINKYFGFPSEVSNNATQRFSPVYTSGTQEWIAVHDSFVSALETNVLSAGEISTKTVTQPATWKEKESGWGNEFLPGRIPILLTGDSIYECPLFDYEDKPQAHYLRLLDGVGTKVYEKYRAYDDTYCIINEAVSGSRYEYTIPSPETAYDWNNYLRDEKLLKISYPGHTLWNVCAIGSNDIKFEAFQDYEACYAKAQDYIAAVNASDRGIQVIMAHLIPRVSMPVAIADYNDLLDSNAINDGALAVIDMSGITTMQGYSSSESGWGPSGDGVHPDADTGWPDMAQAIGDQIQNIINENGSLFLLEDGGLLLQESGARFIVE